MIRNTIHSSRKSILLLIKLFSTEINMLFLAVMQEIQEQTRNIDICEKKFKSAYIINHYLIKKGGCYAIQKQFHQ